MPSEQPKKGFFRRLTNKVKKGVKSVKRRLGFRVNNNENENRQKRTAIIGSGYQLENRMNTRKRNNRRNNRRQNQNVPPSLLKRFTNRVKRIPSNITQFVRNRVSNVRRQFTSFKTRQQEALVAFLVAQQTHVNGLLEQATAKVNGSIPGPVKAVLRLVISILTNILSLIATIIREVATNNVSPQTKTIINLLPYIIGWLGLIVLLADTPFYTPLMASGIVYVLYRTLKQKILDNQRLVMGAGALAALAAAWYAGLLGALPALVGGMLAIGRKGGAQGIAALRNLVEKLQKHGGPAGLMLGENIEKGLGDNNQLRITDGAQALVNKTTVALLAPPAQLAIAPPPAQLMIAPPPPPSGLIAPPPAQLMIAPPPPPAGLIAPPPAQLMIAPPPPPAGLIAPPSPVANAGNVNAGNGGNSRPVELIAPQAPVGNGENFKNMPALNAPVAENVSPAGGAGGSYLNFYGRQNVIAPALEAPELAIYAGNLSAEGFGLQSNVAAHIGPVLALDRGQFAVERGQLALPAPNGMRNPGMGGNVLTAAAIVGAGLLAKRFIPPPQTDDSNQSNQSNNESNDESNEEPAEAQVGTQGLWGSILSGIGALGGLFGSGASDSAEQRYYSNEQNLYRNENTEIVGNNSYGQGY